MKYAALCVLIRNRMGRCGVSPLEEGSGRPYERSKGKTIVLHLWSEKDGSEGETSPLCKDVCKKRLKKMY